MIALVKDTTFTVLGIIAGIVFGVSAVTFLMNLIAGSMDLVSQLGSGVGLVIVLAVAAFIILKVRIVSSMITGAIIGVVANIVFQSVYGTDIITWLIMQL